MLLAGRSVYVAVVVFCCLLKTSNSQDVSLGEALKLSELRGMLSFPVNIKGDDLPNITGPASSDSRIAILGADPAGVHMAYKLKKRGFTNVVILEPGDQVGGKSLTVHHRGVRHELGNGHFRVENGDILSIIDDFRMGPIHPLGSFSVWPNSGRPDNILHYLLIDATQTQNVSDPVLVLNLLSDAIMRYITIHREIFGDYQGVLMRRPRTNDMWLVNGTIEDFLTRNGLTILETLFRVLYTAEGYGYLDKSAALYGLMSVTPKRLLRFIESMVDPTDIGDSYILERGFSELWSEIASKANLNVRLNQNISFIIRTPENVNVYYNNTEDTGNMDTYDFLIIARDMSKVLGIVDTSWIERQIFSHLTPSFMTSSLIDTNFGRRGPMPRAYYMYNTKSGADHSVLYHEDSYSILRNIQGPKYSRGVIPGSYDGELYQSIVVRQYGDAFPSTEDINTGFLNHANLYGITHGLVLARKTWHHFPRFSPVDVAAGVLWDIFTLQGHKNTWYIGSSVCLDSLNSVIDYNNLVLQYFTSKTLQ
ncbi:polyenoic fatty acid isomerase-like [Pecten maximus]|uniref:polyenoic fatty acid isomerase-like n=1 Tax=Pecten maximus TaxID=6579 RepID=UPI0014587B27|nr:polyenoic fatty acid isomerase-like [Pecten maximus]